jgi:hypothetical protein
MVFVVKHSHLGLYALRSMLIALRFPQTLIALNTHLSPIISQRLTLYA